MDIAALALYLLWAWLAFGWRTIDQQRRTSDSGLRLHAQTNAPQWWAKIGFGLAILVGFAAPIAAVVGLDHNERTDLVTNGAFRLARNPTFTAMLITATGLAMMIPNIISLVGLAALIAALEVQVRLVEEPYLVHTDGDQYRAYAQGVGRFAPGIGHID